MKSLSGKNALVTGADHEPGKDIARRLAGLTHKSGGMRNSREKS